MTFRSESNVKEALANLDGFKKELLRESARALDADLETINRGQQSNIPRGPTGRLLDSAFAERARRLANSVEGSVGASIFYALFVHEKPGGKGYKFLERVVASMEDRMLRNQEQAGLEAAKKL